MLEAIQIFMEFITILVIIRDHIGTLQGCFGTLWDHFGPPRNFIGFCISDLVVSVVRRMCFPYGTGQSEGDLVASGNSGLGITFRMLWKRFREALRRFADDFGCFGITFATLRNCIDFGSESGPKTLG